MFVVDGVGEVDYGCVNLLDGVVEHFQTEFGEYGHVGEVAGRGGCVDHFYFFPSAAVVFPGHFVELEHGE